MRESGATGFVLLRITSALIGGRLLAHFMVQRGFFHDPETHLTPAAHDHVFDQGDFDGAVGLEAFEEGIVEFGEALGAFAVDGDGGNDSGIGDVALRGDGDLQLLHLASFHADEDRARRCDDDHARWFGAGNSRGAGR